MPKDSRLTSRYVSTPITDFYLDVWDPVTIEPSADDQEIIIDAKYHERPDLLSFDIYGTPRLWWIFAVRNMDTLVDPIKDFTTGTIVYAPAMKSVERLV